MELFGNTIILLCVSSVYGQCFYTGTCYTAHDKGVSYRGNTGITKSGKQCVPWSRHLHTFVTDRFRYEGLDRNYCRNPLGKRDSPWCYSSPTGDEAESWEYCDVPRCDKCLFRGMQLKVGDQFHDGCSLCICQNTGIRCLDCAGGPKFTNKMGCYVKYNNEEKFPRCCPRIVCHGKDKDFDLTEYFDYLKFVLRAHVAATHNNTTRSALISVPEKTEAHVLP